MIITRSRRLVINATQYESIEVGATVQFDPDEIGLAHDQTLAQFADQYLTDLLEGEMEEAAKVTHNPKSLINEYRYTDTETNTETDRK